MKIVYFVCGKIEYVIKSNIGIGTIVQAFVYILTSVVAIPDKIKIIKPNQILCLVNHYCE